MGQIKVKTYTVKNPIGLYKGGVKKNRLERSEIIKKKPGQISVPHLTRV